jgi:hypothetical protein
MRAVWSFWTKPFKAHHNRVWLTEKHHLFAWILSVETARRRYSNISLFTDDEGASLLVENLGLNFTYVSTELNALQDADPNWWVLGKLWTYRAQTEPYVHIDSDVFLWKCLPTDVERADVFAQNPESFPFNDESWYRPIQYDQAIRDAQGWAPEEWLYYTSRHSNNAICCGILGGNAVEFLSHYADLGIRMIEHPKNERVWASIGNTISDNILIEQYFLSACLDFHRQQKASRFRDTRIKFLFRSSDEAFDEIVAAHAGYTHLIGGAKSNPALAKRLEDRVRRDFPKLYERCLRIHT